MQITPDGCAGLEIRLLGPVEATREGQPLSLGRRKQRALLALLALDANRVVSTDRLIDALWGESPPPSAPVALYGLVSGLRKSLGPGCARVLATRDPGYALELPFGQIDLGRFEQLAVEGRGLLAAGDAGGASARLAEALALWRGPPLQDVGPMPGAQVEIGRLEESRLAAVEVRIDADLARGRDGDLVPELEALVVEHPLRERLRAQLMVALYRSGRQADALAAYRDARAALVELGLEPSDELHELELAILRHDPALVLRALAVAGVVAPPPPGRPVARTRSRWVVAAAGVLATAAAVFGVAATRSGEGDGIHIAANGVGVVEAGKLVAAGTMPSSPGDIAAGAGSLWATSTDVQTVSRIDPRTGEVQQTIQVDSGASGLAADGGGVWVANSLSGTVSRIDPRTNTVVQTIAVGGGPVAVVLGGGGAWVARQAARSVTRVDTRTGAVTATFPVAAEPRALAFGMGSLWVADVARGAVFRLDPDRGSVVDSIAVGNGPVALAFGFGSVWVANSLDGTVSRLDPERGAVAATIEVGDGPLGVAVGRDGVWVANEFDGTLTRIDPGRNVADRVIPVGGRPQGLAAGGARVFAAVRAAGAAHRGGTLRLVGTPPQRLSVDTVNLYAFQQTVLTNDGLVGYRRVGGVDGTQIVPDLALAIPKPTDGGRTYTFRLRSGIRYSTGRLVRAADFRRALERAFLILGPEIYGAYYGGIVGAASCAQGPAQCDLSRGIVVDERARTVTFHLREPDPDFLAKLALPITFAVPADTPAKEAITRPLPATGPYMVRSLRGGVLTLVRNPRFREWSKAAQPAGYPDRIVFTPVGSSREATRAVERGRADYSLDGVPSELVHEVRTRFASQVHVNPLEGTTYLFLDTKARPFDDVRVRRALNYAADRAAAVGVSARVAGGEPTCQILPPELPGFRRYCPYTLQPDGQGEWRAPDLARARRLVAASGTSGAVIRVWVPNNHAGEGPFVADLLRSLGYRPRLKRVADTAYLDLTPRARIRGAQAGLLSWFADFPSASNFLGTLFSCGSPANWSRFCDRRIDAQIRRGIALQATDPYLASRLWQRVDREIVDRAPFVPLIALQNVDVVSRRVGNYHFHPLFGPFLDQLWVR